MYVLIVSTIFTVLATICVVLRLCTRFWLLRAPGLDDLFISCALVCVAIYTLNFPPRGNCTSNDAYINMMVHQIVDLAFYAFVLLGK
jgi:hypothetical protein